MPYEIFIIPSEQYRSEESWIEAVRETEGVRIANGQIENTLNPQTGFSKHIDYYLDAEIFFPSENQWECALRWKDYRIAINARFDIGNTQDPAWKAVSRLAERLEAKILGEEFEEYDVLKGKIISSPKKTELEPASTANNQDRLKGDSFCLAFPHSSYSIFEVWTFIYNWLIDQSLIEKTYLVGRRKSKAEKVTDRLLDRDGRHSKIEGENILIDFTGGNRRTYTDRLKLKWTGSERLDFDSLVTSFESETLPIMAWRFDNQYSYWQNAHDPIQFKAHGMKYDHLPMVPRGSTPPFDKDMIIDTSKNLGKRTFRDGYVEDIGSTMYFASEFWEAAGSCREDVEGLTFVKSVEDVGRMTKFVFQEDNFCCDTGEEGNIQRSLRDALYKKPNKRLDDTPMGVSA